MNVDEPASRARDDDVTAGEPFSESKTSHKASDMSPVVDLATSIPGMYRILDLVSEHGSGGLVDKIIISQESLGLFINDVCPGAYHSMTHVDFDLLDRFNIRPVGIYGSKPEIVRYLRDLHLIDDEIARLLCSSKDDAAEAAESTLRSGLYLIRDSAANVVYVLYWPQDTTWDDNAISSVSRNRETFMRYLTKIADQTVVLISDVHANGIIWDESTTDDSVDSCDDSDRLFTFSVSKTREQEENVTVKPGFVVSPYRLTLIQPCIHAPVSPEDRPAEAQQLSSRLVLGDTNVGVMTSTYVPAHQTTVKLDDNFSTIRLRELVMKGSFQLDESLSEESLEILRHHELSQVARAEFDSLLKARTAEEQQLDASEKASLDSLRNDIQKQHSQVLGALREELTGVVEHQFGEKFASSSSVDIDKGTLNGCPSELLDHLTAMYPRLEKLRIDQRAEPKLRSIQTKGFTTRKAKILEAEAKLLEKLDLSTDAQRELVDAIEKGNRRLPSHSDAGSQGVMKKLTDGMKYVPGLLFGTSGEASSSSLPQCSDAEFLRRLPVICSQFPVLVELVDDASAKAAEYFSGIVSKLIHQLAKKIEEMQIQECNKQLAADRASKWKEVLRGTRSHFLRSVKERFIRDLHQYVSIAELELIAQRLLANYRSFQVIGRSEAQAAACYKYSIRLLQLTEGDKQQLQLESSHVPKPKLSRTPYTFSLPDQQRVVYCQLLEREMCLLITSDVGGDMKVFLDRLVNIDRAVATPNGYKKLLVAEKLGGQSVIAYDERRRMLAVCTIDKVFLVPCPTLHFFLFQETFSTLDGYGASVDLRTWFEAQTKIKHVTFRSGATDELLLVDETRRARIFSLATQSFRPASVQLATLPLDMVSSPDGSCVFAVERHADGTVLQAYHWATFGSTTGICLELPELSLGSWAITSLAKRTSSHCHFVALDSPAQLLKSVVFDITHKSTELTFQADRNVRDVDNRVTATGHTSLITCHRDVWTRFPVIPAVHRHTFKSSDRTHRSLTFVSHIPGDRFYHSYHAMVSKFEHTTRKPIGDKLSTVRISGITYEELIAGAMENVSCFKAGEWVVDMLCLIPIHLAVARDNRFVPLKDGVWSLELERSLLGATIDQVIDALSFGWYESIFQSYMSSKPVKVVSSMGEQSVGKSFTLNHLADTSFAGSAMRTTEGVWMAVTPTDNALIVALDFEGVHSIERTAQEDSLLVLFNTAISNLVLLRNNFALSRDITGLFQSFQSSSTVLDPAASPSLFRSTLVIIIKDVVESDKNEIAKEFSLKFQGIVETEQEANFISRLHRGSLAIIPWPVIGSQQFYALFTTVKKMLDKQDITHPQASTFLHKMKTLMAKLKTNDWGSIDENLASHRAQQLQSLLARALTTGAMELEPVLEPLTDLDTGRPIDLTHCDDKFFLPQVESTSQDDTARKTCLANLRASWPEHNSRTAASDVADTAWAEDLDRYLVGRVESRIESVRAWLDINTARFSTQTNSFAAVRHEFENMTVALKANVRLCKLSCANCQLVCIQPRHHNGVHDCETSHRCSQACSFSSDHGEETKACGMPAGHPGNHICEVSVHLCGKACRLTGKGGCLQRCAKVAPYDHADEEHLCQAREHDCGMACSLNATRLYDGSEYSCSELCCISSEEPHVEHRCKQRGCPIKCELCNRLCADEDHLHGLAEHARHLCGEEHKCPVLCQSDGICRIDPAPESINATFTGRHETFQYTKSCNSVSKRLQCAIPIPPGLTQHNGRHSHEAASNVFHYCKMRCEYCGYFCTLPFGHTQPEHETSHGSMSKTLWAVDGPDGTVLDVGGRKFASNDSGAPMLCSMVCRSLGRHVHIDDCRSQDPATCSDAGIEHITHRMLPEPAKAKDWVSHELFWKRTDPYLQEDKNEFSKCDAMCAGAEHRADANGPAQPSYCSLPIFHPPHAIHNTPTNGIGYISGDGHHFLCRNPAQLQRAFHVVANLTHRSGSMAATDRLPLSNTPVTTRLRGRHNNRIGAVYSSLYTFWQARHAALTAGANRRDAYSVILFDHALYNAVNNDFTSTPDALLDLVLPYGAGGGTEFNMALQAAQRSMSDNWSTERAPVVIFLSDGECSVSDGTIRDLCRRAVALGTPLSFHAVAFGPSNQNLRRMAQIATEVQNTVPADPMHPVVPSSYVEALDSIRLAETFLGIADSLKKPRGALMKS
ncbi:hypothetical protein BC835DRAFT_1277959 [Cytidiella melzeri]|nr:hypothetical protein BC835DRAFT_1277959 [Cytidiella melzeri]